MSRRTRRRGENAGSASPRPCIAHELRLLVTASLEHRRIRRRPSPPLTGTASGFFLVKSNSKPGAGAGPSAEPALSSKAASAPIPVPGGAAGPGAVPAGYPSSRWVEVFTQPEDVPPNAQGAADLQWSDGWRKPGRTPSLRAFPVTDASQGLRARFRFRGGDTNENFLQLRGQRPGGLRPSTDQQRTLDHIPHEARQLRIDFSWREAGQGDRDHRHGYLSRAT